MFSSPLPLQRKGFGPIAELLNRPPMYVKKSGPFCIAMNISGEIEKAFSSSAVATTTHTNPLLLLGFTSQKSAEHHVQQMFSSSALQTMTWLPPIPGLHRRDPEHRYWLHDHQFATSITGVLKVQKSPYAMAKIQATTAIWQPRGHNAHRALELHLTTRFRPPLESKRFNLLGFRDELLQLRSGDHKDWINPLLDHHHWDQVQVIASERPTCCITRNVAGTFDLAYDAPQGRVLADLKTLGPNGSTYCTRAQLGGYMALEATHGNHYDFGQTIWARPGQTTFSTLYSRRECLLAWAAAWTWHKAVQASQG